MISHELIDQINSLGVEEYIEIPCPSCNIKKSRQVRKIKRSLKINSRLPLCVSCASKQSAPIAKSKRKQTMLDRYGVDNPLKLEEFRKKRNQTMLKLYGIEVSSQIPEIAQQIIEKRSITNLKKYGTEHYFKSQEYKNFLLNNPNMFTSNGELEVVEFINFLGFKTQKRRKDNVEIDIFIPTLNLGIEFNGLYWHSEIKRDKKYHLEKYKYCLLNNIKLIQIFEHEWYCRKEQVKLRLKSLLGLNNKVFARKLDLKDIDPELAMQFVNNIHIQKLTHRPLKSFGLLDKNNNIMCLAIFSKHHRLSNKIVLSRFCSAPSITVVGGLSRLSCYASNFFRQDIISWCDLRWSDGNGYIKAGWVEDGVLNPDYFYFNPKNGKVISKQSRMKKKIGTPNHLTESQHAKNDGLLKVWDCGKIRYIYKYRI